jgi:hypothetical protein
LDKKKPLKILSPCAIWILESREEIKLDKVVDEMKEKLKQLKDNIKNKKVKK